MTVPLRVVVVAGYAPSLLNFRGPLLRAIRQLGHQVIALAPEDDAEVSARLAAMGVTYLSISLDRTGLNLKRDFGDVLGLTRTLRELQPDIVLNYTIKPVIYGSFAARMAGVRRVYSLITGLGYAFGGEGIKRRLLAKATGRLYRQALKANKRVIFQNPDDRGDFVRAGIVPQYKTVVVNGSGVDLTYFHPQPLPVGQPVFVLIARLLREKGVGEYVEAARQLRKEFPDIRCLLVGPTDSNPSSFAEQEVAAWQREGVVEYLGTLSDVRPALARASVFVLPSYREGVPRTVLEALALGRPVITADAPGCRETVRAGSNGFLVPVRDVQALAAAMRKFLQRPALVESMGAASLRMAAEKYDVNIVNAQMLKAMALLEGEADVDVNRREDELGKRLFDIVVASAALSVLALPMLALGLLVRLKLGSPVLFRQVRPGLSGQPFPMYKFRSMTDARDASGELLPDAQRLTPFGRFLRSTSLDELPELLNVVRGDMSLVGPRPLLTQYLPLYTAEQARRHKVRPGITGWAQVNGRNAISWEEKFELDTWYVAHHNMILDLNILRLTLARIVARKDVSADAHPTMPYFLGSERGI